MVPISLRQARLLLPQTPLPSYAAAVAAQKPTTTRLTLRPLRPHPMFLGLIAAGVAFANPKLARESLPSAVTRWLRPIASEHGPKAASAVAQAQRAPKSPLLDPS